MSCVDYKFNLLHIIFPSWSITFGKDDICSSGRKTLLIMYSLKALVFLFVGILMIYLYEKSKIKTSTPIPPVVPPLPKEKPLDSKPIGIPISKQNSLKDQLLEIQQQLVNCKKSNLQMKQTYKKIRHDFSFVRKDGEFGIPYNDKYPNGFPGLVDGTAPSLSSGQELVGGFLTIIVPGSKAYLVLGFGILFVIYGLFNIYCIYKIYKKKMNIVQ